VQPQRELVEGERRAHAEQHGHHVQPDAVGPVGQQDRAGAQQQEDAVDLVVQVDPADAGVPERAAAGADGAGDQPGAQEGHQEGAHHPGDDGAPAGQHGDELQLEVHAATALSRPACDGAVPAGR
jgi:hypothetical protein